MKNNKPLLVQFTKQTLQSIQSFFLPSFPARFVWLFLCNWMWEDIVSANAVDPSGGGIYVTIRFFSPSHSTTSTTTTLSVWILRYSSPLEGRKDGWWVTNHPLAKETWIEKGLRRTAIWCGGRIDVFVSCANWQSASFLGKRAARLKTMTQVVMEGRGRRAGLNDTKTSNPIGYCRLWNDTIPTCVRRHLPLPTKADMMVLSVILVCTWRVFR